VWQAGQGERGRSRARQEAQAEGRAALSRRARRGEARAMMAEAGSRGREAKRPCWWGVAARGRVVVWLMEGDVDMVRKGWMGDSRGVFELEIGRARDCRDDGDE